MIQDVTKIKNLEKKIKLVGLVVGCPRFFLSTSLHHLPAGRCSGPRCTPVPPSSAIGDPSGPLGAGELAWLQTRGWGLRSACGPTTGRASQSCNLI